MENHFFDEENYVQSSGGPVDCIYIDDLLSDEEVSATSHDAVVGMHPSENRFDLGVDREECYIPFLPTVNNSGTICDFSIGPEADASVHIIGNKNVYCGKLEWMKRIVCQSLDEFETFCKDTFKSLADHPLVVDLENLFLRKSKGGRSPPPSVIGSKVSCLLVKALEQDVLNKFVYRLEILINRHYRHCRQRRVIKLVIDRSAGFYQHIANRLRQKFHFQCDNRVLDQHKLCGPLQRYQTREQLVAAYLCKYETDEFPILWSECIIAAKRIRNCFGHDDDNPGLYDDLLTNATHYYSRVRITTTPDLNDTDFPPEEHSAYDAHFRAHFTNLSQRTNSEVKKLDCDSNSSSQSNKTLTGPHSVKVDPNDCFEAGPDHFSEEWVRYSHCTSEEMLEMENVIIEPLPYNCTVAQQVEVMRGTLIAGSGNGNSQRRRRQKKSKTSKVTGQEMVLYKPPRPSVPKREVKYAEPSTSSWSAPSIGAGLGSMAGNAIMPGIGGIVGSALGNGLGHLFRYVTGHGEYVVRQNSMINKTVVFEDIVVPVTRKEFLGLVSGSVGFVNNVYSVNPGLVTSFPWCSSIANSFQMWRPRGGRFLFYATASPLVNGTNTAQGNVVMSMDYDSVDSTFTALPQAMSTLGAITGPPNQSIEMWFECSQAKLPTTWLYTRSGAPPANADLRLYDLGTFQFVTDGMAAANSIGSLWVEYDIEFCKPVSDAQYGGSLLTDHWVGTTPAANHYFGTTSKLAVGSNLGTTITGVSLSFPPEMSQGQFLFVWVVFGTSGTGVAIPTITGTNCTAQTFWDNDTATSASNTSTTSTNLLYCAIFSITASGASINFTSGSFPTTPLFSDTWVTQVNGNISGLSAPDVVDRAFRDSSDIISRDRYLEYKATRRQSREIADDKFYCGFVKKENG